MLLIIRFFYSILKHNKKHYNFKNYHFLGIINTFLLYSRKLPYLYSPHMPPAPHALN